MNAHNSGGFQTRQYINWNVLRLINIKFISIQKCGRETVIPLGVASLCTKAWHSSEDFSTISHSGVPTWNEEVSHILAQND